MNQRSFPRGLRPARLACGLLLLLALAACAGHRPDLTVGWPETELPGGRNLVRGGLTPDGAGLVALADGPGRCRAPQLWRLGREGWRLATSGLALAWQDCPAVTAMLAADGRTLAVYDYSAGRATVLAVAEAAITPLGAVTLTSNRGPAFPPPGANLALSADGRALLLGAPNRACGRDEDGDVSCGVAELWRQDGGSWQRQAALRPTLEAAQGTHFGQTVALAPDASLALVGGTGQPGEGGALWVYALADGAAEPIGELRPEKKDDWFGEDVVFSADGSWLAVGAERAVQIYRREGNTFTPFKRLTAPPDPSIGHFGERLAFSADGRSLLVAAPRSVCADGLGERCGLALLYWLKNGYWQLEATLRPGIERPEASFSHQIALDTDGDRVAVQGQALHVFSRP